MMHPKPPVQVTTGILFATSVPNVKGTVVAQPIAKGILSMIILCECSYLIAELSWGRNCQRSSAPGAALACAHAACQA